MAFGARRILFNFQYSLDVAVVLTGWLFDVFFPLATTGTITVAGTDQKGGVQSAVKILRVFRAFRVLRLLTIFEHLWHVVQLFFFSLTPLMWTVLFIMIIIFLFGIFSVVIIGQNDSMTYEADDNNPEHEEAFDNAKSLFGTTRDSIVYLFQMMTLDGWTDMVVPLSNDHIWPYFYFLLFISISALGLMNLVTVTVLETASRQQREVRRNLDIDEKMGEIQDLLQFPGQEVVNTTRTFFIENYKKSLAFRKVFEKLDLTDEDAGYFFDAMDLDSSGELDPFELSTTYMELTTSVMNSTASVALIRSANVPEEKGRILKATMLQAQQSRFQEIAKKNFDDGLKASSRAAVKQNEQMLAAREDRASMSERQDKILNELAALREEVQALNSLREEVSAMRSGGTIKSGGVVVPGGTMGSQHPYNNLHQRPFRSSSRSRVDPDPQFDAVAMMSQTSDGKKAPRAVSSVDLVI
ncbi:unnamed protein product [Amoebophrya sp. A120]|nr:unnamed protein product [Amoebophrya sp. A120]|eukprot:GSA120T00026116001.1